MVPAGGFRAVSCRICRKVREVRVRVRGWGGFRGGAGAGAGCGVRGPRGEVRGPAGRCGQGRPGPVGAAAGRPDGREADGRRTGGGRVAGGRGRWAGRTGRTVRVGGRPGGRAGRGGPVGGVQAIVVNSAKLGPCSFSWAWMSPPRPKCPIAPP
ncbi:hypothetical protein GCM10018781_71740 [Kitasatospora indigofera]|uniref:Uncharacterized protein n=1 Tax=Kitasatospora indigofera TaxID=67307 RepID=A0A919GG28_9ACTN|nr:hypothetical protein GCM10018781_71740 [Kitasatospora indigofera]